MQQLISLLFKLRFFIVFVILQGICALLIVRNNNYQRAAFLSSSNVVVGSVDEFKSDANAYFELEEINLQLLEENRKLRQRLHIEADSSLVFESDSSLARSQFEFVPAQVVKNSVQLQNNFITINKGKLDGVEVGMAVITANGIVGNVKVCSEHYATLFSFLHSKSNVSSEIKRTGEFCTSEWHGGDYHIGQVGNVPAQKKDRVKLGDTIVVSRANKIYPPNIPIGIVKDIAVSSSSNFYDIEMELTTKFSSLNYVYVVKNKAKNTIDSLENVLLEKSK